MFKMSNKVFDVLKWIVIIAIPALTTAYVGLCSVFNVPFFNYAEVVSKTSVIICTLLGTLLGISTIHYNNQPPEGDEEANG